MIRIRRLELNGSDEDAIVNCWLISCGNTYSSWKFCCSWDDLPSGHSKPIHGDLFDNQYHSPRWVE
jgi:hypothetical protein